MVSGPTTILGFFAFSVSLLSCTPSLRMTWLIDVRHQLHVVPAADLYECGLLHFHDQLHSSWRCIIPKLFVKLWLGEEGARRSRSEAAKDLCLAHPASAFSGAMEDQETDTIIKSALEEQEYEKRARKEADPKKGTYRDVKPLTF